jgi:hypothetical protein
MVKSLSIKSTLSYKSLFFLIFLIESFIIESPLGTLSILQIKKFIKILSRSVFTLKNQKEIQEEQMLNNYIQENLIKKLMNKYAVLFKIGLSLLFVIICLCYVLQVCFSDMSPEQKHLIQVNWILFNSFLAVAGWIIHFSPKNIGLVISSFILISSLVYADFLTAHKQYKFDEYILWVFWWIYLLITVFPYEWKMNSAAFTMGVFYMTICVYKKYEEVPVQFYSSFYICAFYIWLLGYIVNYRVKELCRTIRYNEDLVSQNKKVVEFFPHGIIIENSSFDNESNICFANKEFTSQIRNIRSRIEELENIEVTLPDSSNNEPFKDFKIHLLECFKIHSLNPKNKQNLAHELTGVKVRCCLDPDIALRLDEGGEEDFAERIFNIKSIEVIWERKPWHMHVMIDTTDILKLEEARNNIRCQRIMFTSVSHELRTPLNAILNCYYLISQKLK